MQGQFAAARGSWQTVAECCSALAELPDHGTEVFVEHGDLFVVTHLPWGGHLIEAHVWPTLEVVLTESPRHLRRTFRAELGLALIDLK